MAKQKSIYFCRNCGAQSTKWIGKCPSCGEWNTYEEEIIQKSSAKTSFTNPLSAKKAEPHHISEILTAKEDRIDLLNGEINRVLGGGLVKGSIVLIGGEPGIGKSTLLLQLALGLTKEKILYVSGEESERQLKMRADRLTYDQSNCFILSETNTQNILEEVEKMQADLLIIDSIQTLYSSLLESTAGSISQIRQAAAEIQNYAKQKNIPAFLVGHITKDGALAGPKVLEHMVDTVLQFEGEQNHGYRILRTTKNRYGSTSEIGIFEMHNKGLREVKNPSEILLSHQEENLSGIAIAATIEGMRPMLIETQALVSPSPYGHPQRTVTGFDNKRLGILLAVLEKRGGFKLGIKDVFLNIAGGIRVDDPAIDLAVVCSIISSYEDIPIEQKSCFAAEVGLSGEIRPVNKIEQRISEAEKLGFENIFVSKNNAKNLKTMYPNIKIHSVKRIEEVFELLFA
jgi:DNA repair protein RadA/Sms